VLYHVFVVDTESFSRFSEVFGFALVSEVRCQVDKQFVAEGTSSRSVRKSSLSGKAFSSKSSYSIHVSRDVDRGLFKSKLPDGDSFFATLLALS